MSQIRVFLIAAIGSLCLAALLGIGAVIVPRSIEPEPILTMLTLALFTLTALGTALVLANGVWRLLMWLSFAVSGVGLAICLLEAWEPLLGRWDDEAVWLSITWGIALPAAGLLALTRFKGVLAGIRRMVLAIGFVFAGMLSAWIVAEFTFRLWWLGESLGRATAVLAILAILGAVSLPILQKLYGLKRTTESVDLELEAVCPRCLMKQTLPQGESRCVRCRLRFRIDIEEPRCPKCGYLLYKLTVPRCPECGEGLRAEEMEPAATSVTSRSPVAPPD